jgi:mono/diheme cytochrome c family protein
VRIEHALHMLRPPPWPEEILGAIDPARRRACASLFAKHCQECHGRTCPNRAPAGHRAAQAGNGSSGASR